MVCGLAVDDFQRLLNDTFLPLGIRHKAEENRDFLLRYQGAGRDLRGSFSGKIVYPLSSSYSPIIDTVFWKILVTLYEARLEIAWASDRDIKDVQVLSSGSVITNVRFKTESALQSFYYRMKSCAEGIPPEPFFLEIPLEGCLLEFPFLKEHLIHARFVKGFAGVRTLQLTFKDEKSLKECKMKLLQELQESDVSYCKRRSLDDREHLQIQSRLGSLRKARSLQIYENHEGGTLLSIQGNALREFELRANIFLNTTLNSAHLPPPKRVRVKDIVKISPIISERGYLVIIKELIDAIQKARMIQDYGVEILHLQFHTGRESFCNLAYKRITERLKERNFSYEEQEVRKEYLMATGWHLYIQGTALLGLRCLSQLE